MIDDRMGLVERDNAVLAVAGYNFRRLLRWLERFSCPHPYAARPPNRLKNAPKVFFKGD
jgi:hypothetical protein